MILKLKTDSAVDGVLAIREGEYRCYSPGIPMSGWEDAYVYRVALVPCPEMDEPRDEEAWPFGLACTEFGPTTTREDAHWHYVSVDRSSKELIASELLEMTAIWYEIGIWAYLALRRKQFEEAK